MNIKSKNPWFLAGTPVFGCYHYFDELANDNKYDSSATCEGWERCTLL